MYWIARSASCSRASFAVPAVLAGLTVTPWSPTLALDDIELYRRVTPLEATTGVVTIRQALTRDIEVPESCEDGSSGCKTTRNFARVWRIDFDVETGTVSGGLTLVQREGRGTAYLALAATRDDEEGYDELLREALGRLEAAAFDEPFAGLRPDRGPFDGPVAERSVEPSWSCFVSGAARTATVYSRTEFGADGSERGRSTHFTTLGDRAATQRLCGELETSTAAASPEAIRTMSTPRALRETVLHVEVFDRLPEQVYADELVALPEGAELSRKRVPGVGRSEGAAWSDEVVRSRLTVDEVETSARVLPAELPPEAARGHAWLSRWTLETIERRLGPLPESRSVSSGSLTAALLPTLAPRDEDAPSESPGAASELPIALRMDDAAFFRSVAESLEFRSDLSADAVADAIVTKIAGIHSPGWILVLCPPGQEATWGLPPTTGRARLRNGREFCGAVESLLN